MDDVLNQAGTADFERRFGGLRRLYGDLGAQRIFDAHVVVVGIGGVGSWVAEALARSGVRRLTLIDLDHVSESNINRQVHANDQTLGQSKGEAMRERIAAFHPGCVVDFVDDFVSSENWPQLLDGLNLQGPPEALVDACDQVKAKTAMAAWSLAMGVPLVCIGAAGGKRRAQDVEVGDLVDVSHDPLLAKLRYQLRKFHSAKREGKMKITCVFSREAVMAPDVSCEMGGGDGSLNCHGYGSVVSVTATFGMCAAGSILNALASNFKTS